MWIFQIVSPSFLFRLGVHHPRKPPDLKWENSDVAFHNKALLCLIFFVFNSMVFEIQGKLKHKRTWEELDGTRHCLRNKRVIQVAAKLKQSCPPRPKKIPPSEPSAPSDQQRQTRANNKLLWVRHGGCDGDNTFSSAEIKVFYFSLPPPRAWKEACGNIGVKKMCSLCVWVSVCAHVCGPLGPGCDSDAWISLPHSNLAAASWTASVFISTAF